LTPNPITNTPAITRFRVMKAVMFGCEASTQLVGECLSWKQYSPHFLARFDEERRYATLVALLVELAAILTNTALEMHDHIMDNLFKQGQHKQHAHFEQRGQAINEKVRLYATVGKALTDP
jgi:hypothetical protein